MSGGTACACGAPGCACAPADVTADVAPAARFTHGAIFERLIAALGEEGTLDGLSTRDSTDPAIALIDAWAGALHVLAFSAARLAEDVDLAVSQDKASLLELTRLIGYAPRPAISAATTLAFTVDPNAPSDPTIPAGTQVATIPRANELPLTFETASDLLARSAWNAFAPARAASAQVVTASTTELVISGTNVVASLGDAVLARISDTAVLFGRLTSLARVPDPQTPRTSLILTGGVKVSVSGALNPAMGEVIILGVRTSAFGALAPNYQLVKPGTNSAAIGAIVSAHTIPPESLRLLATTFGSDPIALAIAVLAQTDWPGLQMPADGTVDLSTAVKEALPGRAVLFSADGQAQAGVINTATDAFRADFGLNGPVTRITVAGVVTIPGQTNSLGDKVRQTAIWIETERHALLATPDPDEVIPHPATPDHVAVVGGADLPVGRRIALVGVDAATGAPLAEAATIQSVTPTAAGADLTLTAALNGVFKADGLVINGNVVEASHGATPPNQPELLGASDATRLLPTYPLSAGPVTYVADNSALGYSPPVEVRVAGRLYTRVDRFLDLTDDRAWRLRQRRDGGFMVQFAGRLPTAVNSVTARYRVGAGAAGNIDAGRVAMVMTPVLGVSKVTNVRAAEGGVDADGPDAMRRAGDGIVLLDRVVALTDYERYAQAFRGVTNAMATELRQSLRRTVYLTIAGANGQPPSPQLVSDLGAALAKVTAPGRRLRIVGFTPLAVGATVLFAHDPAYVRATVQSALLAALLKTFSATARRFGQPLYASEVIAVAQGVTGVLAALVTFPNGGDVLPARPPRLENGVLLLADLIAVDANGLQLGVLTL
jgi:hypothetical protein